MNPFLAFSGIGMMAVGVAPIIYWKYKKNLTKRFFVAGAFIWFLAIALKVIMDLTISPGLSSTLKSGLGLSGFLIFWGAIIGLRTGLLENGLQYLGIRHYKPLSKMNFDESVAFGLGFGCFEAIVLGGMSLTNIIIFMFSPELAAMAGSALNADTLIIGAAVIERIFTVLAHLTSTLLVVYATRENSIKYFAYAVLYKTAFDGVIPWMSHGGAATGVASAYTMQIPFILIGGVGLWIADYLRRRFSEKPDPGKEGTKFKLIIVALTVAFVLVIAGILNASVRPVHETPFAERAKSDFSSERARYLFYNNGTLIGYSIYETLTETNYDGKKAFIISETTDIKSGAHDYRTDGSLLVSEDGTPLGYDATMSFDEHPNKIMVDFGEDINEKINKGSENLTIATPLKNHTYILSNNVILHLSIIFKTEVIEQNASGRMNIYSPNTANYIDYTITNLGKEKEIVLGNRTVNTEVYEDSLGYIYYVSEGSELIKVEKGNLEIIKDFDY